MKKAALYVRVSTEEQKRHGLSVDNQLEALEEYTRQQGYVIAGIYNDAGISAAKSYKKRPELLRMISDCKAKKIDIVLFTRLDRFFRSVPDYYACIEQMEGTPWRAIWEDYETETSSGVFKVNIMLSIAQAEASRTSEKIKSVMDYKRAKGDYLGGPPLGYKRNGNTLEIDEEKKEAIEIFFKTYLQQFSTAAAIRAARLAGLAIHERTGRRMLSNPAYMGKTSAGIIIPAYISGEDFQKIQEINRKRTRLNVKTGRVYLFSGLLVCKKCGYNLNGGTTDNLRKVYKCRTLKHPESVSITEKKLENLLLSSLDDLIEAHVEKIKTQSSTKLQKKAAQKKKALEAKLARVVTLFEEGDLSLESYKEKRDAIKKEIEEISIEPAREVANLPDNWRTIYEQLDDEHRRAFWRAIVKEIRIDNENKEAPDVYFK